MNFSEIPILDWHALSWKESVKSLYSDQSSGLEEDEAKRRRKVFGRNSLPAEKPLSKTKILLNQLNSPLMIILILAGIIIFFFKEYTDAAVILGAVFLNIIVGYLQENKADNSLRELKKAVKMESQVIRGGNKKLIDSEMIVPGDILILNPGDKVGADARIIRSDNLKLNEMALTGEWLASSKKEEQVRKEDPLAERDNMVYMGTIVEEGTGRAVVVATGLGTEIGKIVQLVKDTKEEKTPLQKKVSKFSHIIAGVIFLISLFIFIEGVLTGNSVLEMFTVAVAVSVAAVPEGLPIALTVILALGMQRILKEKGLVRRLSSAETLGGASVIITDKTGTLTEGKMQVSEILASTEGDKHFALEIAALSCEAFIENPEDAMEEWVVRGRPTDKALLLAAMQAGINKIHLESKMEKIAEIPFSSDNKYLAKAFSLNKNEDVLFVSGAPERLLRISKYISVGGERETMTSEREEEIKIELENLTARGLRVIAVASKKIDSLKDLINGLTFNGMIALKDPVRKEVRGAVNTCRRAGMKVIIATGDHKLTAMAVAEEIGLEFSAEDVLEGKELDRLSDEEFSAKVEKIKIYSRLEPRQKMRIVSAWQEMGEVVAMTGDGMNDAPALKKADIGVALGSGTEVAKESSDLVLLSDSFNVIVSAVREGRAILDNMRKVITYLLTDSFAETILVGGAILFGFPLPITAAQILWVNLIEDGLPDIALGFEPKEKDIMARFPEKKALLNSEMKFLIFIIGILTNIILIFLFWWLLRYSGYEMEHMRTVMFSALALNSLFYVFSCKSLRRNLWKTNPFSNRFLIYAWLFGIAGLMAAVYLPPLQVLLKTVPLSGSDWLMITILSLLELGLIEMTKYVFIKIKKV